MNSHDHSHDHSHHHEVDISHAGRAFIVGIVLNLAFVGIELTAGVITHSLSLVADAWHNLSDVASLALSLVAFHLAQRKPTHHYTYGYRKSTILVSLANAILLLVAVGGIGYEAVLRLLHPQTGIMGFQMAIIAGIGIGINGFTAWLFMRGKDHDLNMKGAYLHMAADALVSIGVVAAGIIIAYTHWYWLDPVISLIIMIIIVTGTTGLLKDSLRLSIDGVPTNIDVQKIEVAARKTPGIQDIHHIHVWAMSTTTNALTAHLLIDPTLTQPQQAALKANFRHTLEHLNIHHATLETETEDCTQKSCTSEEV